MEALLSDYLKKQNKLSYINEKLNYCIKQIQAGPHPVKLNCLPKSHRETVPTTWLTYESGAGQAVLSFPPRSQLWPDMIFILNSSKQLIMLELMEPGEDHMDEANEKKLPKHQESFALCSLCKAFT